MLILINPNFDLETEYIAKNTRIELSNDAFAERKCCQVVAYEWETFHSRRPNGISHYENGEQNRQNLPFPLHDVKPHLIQQCLGHRTHHPKPQLRRLRQCRTRSAVNSPLVTMARFAPKSTPSHGSISKPLYLPHPQTRPTYNAKRLKRHPDPIRRFSTVHWTDQRTDRPTDRSRESLTTIGP